MPAPKVVMAIAWMGDTGMSNQRTSSLNVGAVIKNVTLKWTEKWNIIEMSRWTTWLFWKLRSSPASRCPVPLQHASFESSNLSSLLPIELIFPAKISSKQQLWQVSRWLPSLVVRLLWVLCCYYHPKPTGLFTKPKHSLEFTTSEL